ncbi:8-oxoguanine deaminase [Nocardia sp. NRRL S-836]|uniref:8-oxoguanine deaminase n=1 Tax=Nocardia sp. NRRL S-836 TaxID=1519492 RepID=UPI0006AFA8C1|nr:8-oxoguanine deaminase [Nocardia sp. NRRL S-836]KOV84478.1 hydroxydechloroatrazine ethylaminohydrolase [Nocardia sp. NRRL S-836]
MIVLDRCAVSTVDSAGTEHRSGHVVVDGGRIVSVGPGPAPAPAGPHTYVDASSCLVTPGLINTHHHLYQWATRGLATDATLFEWLTALYPVWRGLDDTVTHAAASAGLAKLALTGCTLAADHHYVFPSGGGDVFDALVSAGRRIGIRLEAIRGSMDRGQSSGGLPPDNLVEETEAALVATEQAIRDHHSTADDALVRVAVGPCSPFSVSKELMTGAAALARRHGVRLHTHLAETLDEGEQCRAENGCTPTEYAEQLGWLGPDVWLAHTVHLDAAAVKRLGATSTGSAHCPTSNGRLGTGIAPVRDLLDAGAPVGLGVDGAASNEDGGLVVELRSALYQARQRGGPGAMDARTALWMATMGGARVLGRDDALGSVEPGKLADLAVWDLSGLDHAGIADPVAALVLGSPPPLKLLLVGGEVVVRDGVLRTAPTGELARDLATASAKLQEAAR